MFQVKWIQTAVDNLAQIWIQADSPARVLITSAANSLDDMLQTDPLEQSESRDDDERVTFAYPLGAEIEVDPNQGVVWGLHVWRFRRRGE